MFPHRDLINLQRSLLTVFLQDCQIPLWWMIPGLFGLIFTLEMLTPTAYVMGYLYIGPIALASFWFGPVTTTVFTGLGAILTLLNIWIPGEETVQVVTVINRSIVVLALIMTALLSDRNRQFQTILTQQQAKLQAQEKIAHVREDFASTLAHDLKMPLLGAIETLTALQIQSFGAINPQQTTVLDTVIRSHQTSLQLVETLLDVYRNDTEGLQLQRSPVELVSLAEEVADILANLAASRRIHLSLHHGSSDFRQVLWVNGDAFQLKRVFTNLLTNAINHAPRGTKVEIVLETQASHQVVRVMDTGSGIKPEEMPHLFERFYQGQSDRQAQGSGLGLYLTRQIITAHGGTIWAENRSGAGAIFSFRLPVLPCPTLALP